MMTKGFVDFFLGVKHKSSLSLISVPQTFNKFNVLLESCFGFIVMSLLVFASVSCATLSSTSSFSSLATS